MLHLLAAHRHLPGRIKALGCWSFAVAALLVAGVYLLTWRHYESPDYARWVEVPGTVNSDGSSWKPDRSLIQFGVRFTLPGAATGQVGTLYADKHAFKAAGLRKGAAVMLAVEPVEGQVIMRELSTLEGRVLYDDSLYRHVVKANNDGVWLNLLVFPVLALVGLLAGLYLRLRGAREERSAP